MPFMSFKKDPRPVDVKDYKDICDAATFLCGRTGKHVVIEDFLTYLAASVGDSARYETHGTPRLIINAGQADFYTDTDTLLTGAPDNANQDIPSTSVLGRLLSLTAEISYTPHDAPSVKSVSNAFRQHHAHTPFGHVTYPHDWPKDCQFTPPPIAPLQAAYEMRPVVQACATSYNGDTKGARHLLATHALAHALKIVNGALSPRRALHLVVPTIFSIAHRSPITSDNRKESERNDTLSYKKPQPAFTL